MLNNKISKKLYLYKKGGIYRNPYKIDIRNGKYVFINKKKCINFASNDYLGIASSNKINQIVADSFFKFGTSSSSSRLISGNYSLINDAEKIYADYFGYEDAIFFPSGYQANLAVISALFQEDDIVLFDKHIHSSIIKGIILSGARYMGFNHNSISHLKRRLSNLNNNRVSIITESLFSMDGDLLPIKQIKELKKQHSFFCIVDEAHAFGVLGEKGRGISYGVADIAIGTFGKAFGFFGAFVLTTKDLKEYMFNFSSPLIYSTAIPVAHAAASIKILSVVSDSDEERNRLLDISNMAIERLKREGFSITGNAHIICIQIGDEKRSSRISQALMERGIFLPAIRYPTVPLGKAILRISLTAMHKKEDIEYLIDNIRRIWIE